MTQLVYVRERVLIWGKTYPELSTKYAETVCTAGVCSDGRPIRLYPVPLRYLGTNAQYQLYDWIDVPICKSRIDSRPESFKVDAANIRRTGHVPPDSSGWSGRASFVMRDSSWHFENMAGLKAAEAEKKHSLGLITPGSVERITVTHKPKSARVVYEDKMKELQSQQNLFLPEYKELGFRPFDIRLEWRCQSPCATCAKRAHDMLVLDWGLLELARKHGWDYELAKSRLEHLADMSSHDFRLFLGNMKNHQKSFVIVGLWYPKKQPQAELF